MPINLQLEQTLTETAQLVKDENGNTSQFALSSDKVGIGTTSPQAKLEVSGGPVSIVHSGEGAVLLFLGIERHWQMRQLGKDSQAALELASVGGGGNKNFVISTAGNVGIGTTSPTTKLHVSSVAPTDPNNAQLGISTEDGKLLLVGRAASYAFVQSHSREPLALNPLGNNVGVGTTEPQEALEVIGNIQATGDLKLSGEDCAEEFDIDDGQEAEPGTVMIIGNKGKLGHCTVAYDTRVAGVISGAMDYRPGIILGKQCSIPSRTPLALMGKVYCKVDAQYATVGVGDLLTTSPTIGYAMKATDTSRAVGAIVGKALGSLTSGQALVPILIALQ